MLDKGDVFKTNYSERIFKVLNVVKGCTCARFSDQLGVTKSGMEKKSPEHWHITSIDLDDGRRAWHSGYKEENGKIISVWDSDEIFILRAKANKQLSLF